MSDLMNMYVKVVLVRFDGHHIHACLQPIDGLGWVWFGGLSLYRIYILPLLLFVLWYCICKCSVTYSASAMSLAVLQVRAYVRV